MRTHHLSFFTALALSSLNTGARAQVTNYQAPITGDWSNAALWSNGVPDAPTAEAEVAAIGAPYTLTLDIDANIARLTLNSTAATLEASGRTLSAGTLVEFLAGRATFTNSEIASVGNFVNFATFDTLGNLGISTPLFEQRGTTNIIAAASGNASLSVPNLFNVGVINLTSTAATSSRLTVEGFTNAGPGTIRFEPGAGGERTLAGSLFNSGLLDVACSGSITGGSSFSTVNQGVFAIASGATLSIEGAGNVHFLNNTTGRVTGSGTLDLTQVDVFNNPGVFAPGDNGVGALTVLGNYRQTGPGGLEVELAGPSSSEFDRLLVSGSVRLLSGQLSVQLVDGFIPTPDDSFTILDGASLSGAFSNAVTTVDVISGGTFSVLYDPSAGTVTLTNFVVPSPAAAGLFALAGIASARRRR